MLGGFLLELSSQDVDFFLLGQNCFFLGIGLAPESSEFKLCFHDLFPQRTSLIEEVFPESLHLLGLVSTQVQARTHGAWSITLNARPITHPSAPYPTLSHGQPGGGQQRCYNNGNHHLFHFFLLSFTAFELFRLQRRCQGEKD